MTSPGPCPGDVGRRQKRMGPAPFASFEDLSDEVRSRLESPEEKSVPGSVVRLPGIREDATPTTPSIVERAPSPAYPVRGISLIGVINKCPSPTNPAMTSLTFQIKPNLKPTTTPRIDISRASSSSHHDSRDSSPEREIFDSRDPNSAKLGLGFKEDGALDLRSSTEELDFQDVQEKKKNKAKPQSPTVQEDASNVRKDSQCSDIILLSISGRTSRLSSIGSQGSGQSRLSNASHLSVMSGQSGLSRSSSPHKMVLETSFCGTKPPETAKSDVEQPGTKVESEVMEKVLLSRKHDPTEAILAEGISVAVIDKALNKVPPEKPLRKTEPRVENVRSDVKIKIDKPASESNSTEKMPKRFVSESGVEYIYIPLKGPLPIENEIPVANATKHVNVAGKQKLREVKSASFQSKTPLISKPPDVKQKSKSTTPSPVIQKKIDEPKYIRIKLKPDSCYDDGGFPLRELRKPDSLELDNVPNIEKPNTFTENTYLPRLEKTRKSSTTPNGSPKLPRDSGIAESNIESVTPSPSVSRRSSFASLFKSKEAVMSPESPSIPGHKRKNTLTGILREASDSLRTRSRSRSKSRDRDSHKSSLSTAPSSTESIDSKSKHKSVLSLFKSNKKYRIKSESENSSQETLPSIEGIGKVEFKFNEPGISKLTKTHYENPLDAASVRIPLHSPTYYEERNVSQDWKTSSQDSQETVIEAPACKNVNVVVETVPLQQEPVINKSSVVNKYGSRQSSTSSENVVFSTKLGSDNEIFTTKLPKKLPKEPEVKTVVENGMDSNEILKEDITITNLQRETQDLKNERTEDKTCNSTVTKSNSIKLLECTENENLKRISQISTGALSSVSSIVSSNAEEDRNSSESERDSEDLPRSRKDRDLKLDLDISEPERKAIVFQQDSFEDELPYIPTTLPLERSAAVPIVPIKQRSTFEIKTCPIERPRSTTPINPSCLEEYCEEVMGSFNVESVTKTIEKLKISLPRNESFDGSKVKSPRKKESNTNWQEFAEKGISVATRSTPTQVSDTPPPLPPKGLQKAWINFEEIPEKRKAPKRIQTIPSRSYIEVPESVLQESVVYNYVNPDECKCECHEINAKERERRSKEAHMPVQEDELPLLEDDVPDEDKTGGDCSERMRLDVTVSDCRSIISDSSVDLSTSVDPQDISCADVSLRTPFTSDLGISSNRSSIVSQDEHQSPGSPNAFPKIS